MKNLARIVAVPLLVLTACTSTIYQNAEPPVNQVLVSIASRWTPAPPEVGYKEEWAYATLLLLEGNGRLLMMDCVLRREPSGLVAISAGDGFNLYWGEWRRNPRVGVDLAYRLGYRSISRVPPEKLPGPEAHATGKVSAGSLLVGGKEFVVSEKISRGEMLEFFPKSVSQ